MRREYDTRFYKVVKKITPDNLSNGDRKYLDGRIASFAKQKEGTNRKCVEIQMRRMDLADLARRIVFKGVPYPQRDRASLPVWTDPDA